MQWNYEGHEIEVMKNGMFLLHSNCTYYNTLECAREAARQQTLSSHGELNLPCLLPNGQRATIRAIHVQNGDFLMHGSAERYSTVYPLVTWIKNLLTDINSLYEKAAELTDKACKLHKTYNLNHYQIQPEISSSFVKMAEHLPKRLEKSTNAAESVHEKYKK